MIELSRGAAPLFVASSRGLWQIALNSFPLSLILLPPLPSLAHGRFQTGQKTRQQQRWYFLVHYSHEYNWEKRIGIPGNFSRCFGGAAAHVLGALASPKTKHAPPHLQNNGKNRPVELFSLLRCVKLHLTEAFIQWRQVGRGGGVLVFPSFIIIPHPRIRIRALSCSKWGATGRRMDSEQWSTRISCTYQTDRCSVCTGLLFFKNCFKVAKFWKIYFFLL